jgi:hypothetical protein
MKSNQQRRAECLTRAREIMADFSAKYHIPVPELIAAYDWEEEKIAHRLGHAYYGLWKCPWCQDGLGSLADLQGSPPPINFPQ